MNSDEDLGGRHFSGMMTRMLFEHLEQRSRPGAAAEVLRDAGETRSIEQLCRDDEWNSYRQFRRLLEAVSRVLGGPQQLIAVGRSVQIVADGSVEYTEMLQSLGSPATLFADMSRTTRALAPIVAVETEEVGATEWIMRQRFEEGFEPFPEFCAFSAGLGALTPTIFGYPPAEVWEEACQCRGASWCSLRIRWEAMDEPLRRADYYETRAQLLEGRLATLHETLGELVTKGDLDDLLARVVASAARAVRAPGYVLALSVLPSEHQRIHSIGLPESDAFALAKSLFAGTQVNDEQHLVVDVSSSRRAYGHLAAVNPTGKGFFPQERASLQAYGRFAAAALDSAIALEAAQALLELSNSLAEVTTVEEIGEQLARTMPKFLDCDRATVILCKDDSDFARVVGAYGYPPAVDAALRAHRFNASIVREAVSAADLHDLDGGTLIGSVLPRTGSIAAVTTPIVANGKVIGLIGAGVIERPERLRLDPDLPALLRGLASQAATAIRSVQLVVELRHQALHDALTGLPNRTLIVDRAEQLLKRARRDKAPVAALFIDLDGFKHVNDTQGHEVGDRLLRAVADRLRTALRDSDTLARIGGDEFVALLEGMPESDVELVADRVLELLRQPFEMDGPEPASLQISASVGIAVGDRPTPAELLRDADIALYQAKSSGKNGRVTFRPALQMAAQTRAGLATDLRTALASDEFFLVYQPTFDLPTLAITGVEALLRWRHPERGVVMPGEFISILEESDAIIDVGRWVLREACREAVLLHAAGHALTIAVNVSMKQLESDEFVRDITDALVMSGLQPHMLELEVTEDSIMTEAPAMVERLTRIKALGVRLAIDDFGTGYSSLAYLRQLPIDSIKIDRSFIAAIGDSPAAAAVIQTLVQLGQNLGISTLAEGIEQRSQLEYLQDQQCDHGQGFWLTQALTPPDLEHFLRSYQRATQPTG
ncbi:MAG TPA: EAL domain-containing protein [Acidimicrobiales bacterium]|nr:EAL domain-containing protein [Acidimicrobiales bacterium]